jgi:phytoene dehydrogenase-like protein
MTAAEYDIIVIGAGHNSLISAAYLGLAGLRVLVLEGQGRPGGNTMTEELTIPGFRHDSCSTAHTLIQANPMLRANELQLDRFGLRYLRPDPVFVISFADGESLTMHRDLEKTVGEIERFSARDAAAYRLLLADWEMLRPLQAAERNALPLPPEESIRLWRSGPLGDEGLRIYLSSGLAIIEERFEEPHVRAFLAWLASMTMEPIDQPHTGILPFSLTAGRQEQSWAIPEGGSGALPDALVRVIEACGGEVVCDASVQDVVIEDGRVVGARTRDGRTYQAGQAVLSSAHIAQLPAMLGDALDGESAAAIDRWRAGLTMFVSHYAISEAPRYRTHDGEVEAVALGTIESVNNLHGVLEDFRRGRLHLDEPMMLCLSPTVLDPSRAPNGGHTLKVIGFLPYELAGGPERWDEVKDEVARTLLDRYLSHTTNLTPDHVLGRLIESPLDLERRNPNNYRGSCHAGAAMPTQSGWYRPAPAWNSYRTPVPGFYLTGASTHPGGSVSGFPGRNAARVILEDLSLSWEDALARVGDLADRTTVPR